MITPEEIIDVGKWLVLQAVKLELLHKEDMKKCVNFVLRQPSLEDLPPHRQRQLLYKLQEEGAFSITADHHVGMIEPDVFRYWLTINRPKFDELCKSYKHKAAKIEKKLKAKNIANTKNLVASKKGKRKSPILIKKIKLDEHEARLIINNNVDETIYFNKKDNWGETKLLKILSNLWKYRRENKNGKTRMIDSAVPSISLENLTTMSECQTDGATYQIIKRLNDRFKKEKVPIKIIRNKDQFYLLMTKS